MKAIANPRWLISFADLLLLLLAFFVLLHARGSAAATAESVRVAFGHPAAHAPRSYPASALFQPGEAVFRPGAAGAFGRLGRRAAAAHARVRIESSGRERAAARFDGWELAAARAAALARAVALGGLPQDHIDIALLPSQGRPTQQLLTITPAL